MAVLCISGCTKKMTVQSILIDGQQIPVDVLIKINDDEISLFEYRYYFAVTMNNSDSDDMSAEDIRNEALTLIRNTYARYALAEELGIKLKKENNQTIKSTVKQYKEECGGNEQYKAALAEVYLDEALFEKLLQTDELSSLIYDYYFGDNGINKLSVSDITDYVSENYIHYMQIYVRFDYDGTQTNKQLMDSLKAQLDNGADFSELMLKYSRDDNVSLYPGGYYAEKDYDSDLLKNLFMLETGEHSDVITGKSGYYIYKRLDIDDDVLKNIDTFRSAMETSILNDLIEDITDKQSVKIVSEYYNKIDAGSILY